MDQQSKLLITIALIFVGLGLLLVIQSQSFGNVRLIACDVGQGDGLLLITPSGRQILVDGGPGNKILECLSNKMPFWDRTIDLIVSTHPQKDHMEGLVDVLARYKVGMIATTGVKQDSAMFAAWTKSVVDEGAKVYVPKSADQLKVDGVDLEILWPTAGKLAEWKVAEPKDLNESSIVMRVNWGAGCAYLTGDIPKEILVGLIDRKCQILKIAHHGSKTGTSPEILEKADPDIAIIQTGKNSYGHPHKEVVDMLESKGVKILRNDTEGTVEISPALNNYGIKISKKL